MLPPVLRTNINIADATRDVNKNFLIFFKKENRWLKIFVKNYEYLSYSPLTHIIIHC